MANKKSLDNITSLKKEYSKLVSVKNELIQDKKFFEKDINCKVNLKELLKQKEFLEEKVICPGWGPDASSPDGGGGGSSP